MSAVPAPRTGFKFMLKITAGADRGSTYQLLPPRVTIGRGPDNHVVLSDPKVSRSAAIIEFSMEEITIQDVSTRPSMTVNSEALGIASIRNGDVITVGDTTMSFIVEALPLFNQVVPRPLSSMNSQTFGEQVVGFPPPTGPSPTRPPRAQTDSSRVRFYVIVGVTLAFFVWLLNSETAEKPKEKGLRTLEERELELQESEKRNETLVKKRTFASDEEKTRYEEAQKHFLEGFRDYQKGKWQRAVKSFETAQAIDPRHTLAGRYYRLAEKQRDDLIARMTLEGRRYKEKNMFKRCSASFEKVMDAIANGNDVRFKQAEAFKKECDLLLDQRFN